MLKALLLGQGLATSDGCWTEACQASSAGSTPSSAPSLVDSCQDEDGRTRHPARLPAPPATIATSMFTETPLDPAPLVGGSTDKVLKDAASRLLVGGARIPERDTTDR